MWLRCYLGWLVGLEDGESKGIRDHMSGFPCRQMDLPFDAFDPVRSPTTTTLNSPSKRLPHSQVWDMLTLKPSKLCFFYHEAPAVSCLCSLGPQCFCTSLSGAVFKTRSISLSSREMTPLCYGFFRWPSQSFDQVTEWRSEALGPLIWRWLKWHSKWRGGQVPKLSAYEYIKAWRQEIAQAQSQGWRDQSSLHLGHLLLYWSLKKGMRGLLWKWPPFRMYHSRLIGSRMYWTHAVPDSCMQCGIYHLPPCVLLLWKCPRTWVLEGELPTPVNVKPENGLLVETMVSETVILGLTFTCVNCATVRWVATAFVVDISWDLLFQCPAEGFTFTMMCCLFHWLMSCVPQRPWKKPKASKAVNLVQSMSLEDILKTWQATCHFVCHAFTGECLHCFVTLRLLAIWHQVFFMEVVASWKGAWYSEPFLHWARRVD